MIFVSLYTSVEWNTSLLKINKSWRSKSSWKWSSLLVASLLLLCGWRAMKKLSYLMLLEKVLPGFINISWASQFKTSVRVLQIERYHFVYEQILPSRLMVRVFQWLLRIKVHVMRIIWVRSFNIQPLAFSTEQFNTRIAWQK